MGSESTSNFVIGMNEELSSPRPFYFYLVSGEGAQFFGKCSEGFLTLTNYRMIMQFSGGFTYLVPLGVIEQTEVRKVVCLYIHCKDARSYKCTFPTSEVCLNWQKRIGDAIAMPSTIEKVFAFTFYHATFIDNPEIHSYFSSQMGGFSSYINRSKKIFDDEVKRLGFDIVGAWRISTANENYELCPSYPRRIIVPSSISDNILEEVARFRSSRRIPTVVWRHPNGAVIARSSQPEVGWLCWRSNRDEDLVKALAEACAYDSPSLSSSFQSQNCQTDQMQKKFNALAVSDLSSICDLPEAKSQSEIKKLLIMDARSYPTAVANRARGGGCECLEYYPMCDIQFMSLDNIHTIRKSHQALRNMTSLSSDIPNWLSLLENTRWLYHMAGLIKAAVTVAQTIALDGRPVLVHCSDGWDRTPQITALAEILLDPYYRTLDGFQVLVEREWIEFGHKFSDRCGLGTGSEDLNERCPVFLQWIDCVHQIVNQYPTVFQFNQTYLVKLAQHVYSGLYGTFLFNSSQERFANDQQYGKTIPFSVWRMFNLHQHRYINHLYCYSNKVLYPSYHTKDLVLFKAVYMSKMGNYQEDKPFHALDIPYEEKEFHAPLENELIKTKSCDNLMKLPSTSSQIVRRSSDPNLRESFPSLALLQSALGVDTFEENNSNSLPQLDKNSSASRSSDRDSAVYKEKMFKPVITFHHSTEYINSSFETQSPRANGNPKFFLEEQISGTENASETFLQKVNKNADKRSIEGSTDTLVSENGVLNSEEGSSNHKTVFQDKKLNGSLPPKSSKYMNGSKCTEENGRKLSGKGLNLRNFINEERVLDDAQSHCFVASSVAACSICLKTKKFINDGPDLDIWKYNGNDDVVLAPTLVNGVTECRGLKTGHYATPGHSTSNSSCIPSTPNEERYFLIHQEKSLPFSDGLTNYNDDITRSLNRMKLQHQNEIDNLKREVQAVKSIYHHLIHKFNHSNNENHTEDQVSLPESIGSGSGDSVGPESGLSDASWEALEEGEAKTTLWVPDHAVDSCMGCQSRFWIGRRKHHCRSCGKIFCAECSGNSAPIPKENLFDPVRVCGTCFSSLLDFRPKYVQVASN